MKAVIVGGGIAGLAAAKVLSKYYSEVQLYMGDIPSQSYHLHVLLKSGQECLEKIFPGILSQLKSKGCPEIDWSLDTLWENRDGEFPRYPSEVKALSMSRIILADTMKELVLKTKVKIIQDKLLDLKDIDANLIVLAGGQNFPLGRFIGESNYTETEFPINLTYRSFIFHKQDLDLVEYKQYYFQIDPQDTRIGGVISPIEGDKVIVTLIESEEQYSECSNYEEFLKKASGIPSHLFTNILAGARPCAGPFIYRKKSIFRRKILNLPENVIVLGDSVMSLNPVFGQGMTVALKEAELLDEMLASRTAMTKFQERVENLSTVPYYLSRFGSLENGLGKKTLRYYLKACQKNPGLHHIFLKQLHSLRVIP